MELLPNEIQELVLSYLSLDDLGRNLSTCKTWHSLITYILLNRKINCYVPRILASMVKTKSKIIILLYPKLTAKMKNYICAFYAYYGDMDGINYCLNHGAQWNYKSICYACYGNRDHIIEHFGIASIDKTAFESYRNQINCSNQFFSFRSYNHENLFKMYISGNMYGDIVTQFLINNINTFLQTGNIIATAIRQNRMDIIEIMTLTNYPLICGYECQTRKNYTYQSMCIDLLKNNNLDMIKWFLDYEEIYSFRYTLMLEATKYGNLIILKLLMIKQVKPDIAIVLSAIKYGHMNIIEWIIDHNFFPLVEIIHLNYLDQDEWIRKKLVSKHNGSLIKWLLNKYPNLSMTIAESTAIKGDIECFQYLIQNKYLISYQKIFYYAAKYGNSHFLDLIHQMDQSIILSEWSKSMRTAILNGKISSVQWLINHWTPDIRLDQIIYNLHLHKQKKCYIDGSKRNYIKPLDKIIKCYQDFLKKLIII